LFSLFFTTKPRGLGIGLTLAHRAIERFGGTIRADSTPGAGTVFIIELPAA
jgi:signal transduction histidine kinase